MTEELIKAHEEVYGFKDATVTDDGSVQSELLKVYLRGKELGIDIKLVLQSRAFGQALEFENRVLKDFMGCKVAI